jgi:hypothetical protein
VEALIEERTGLSAERVEDVVAELALHGLVTVTESMSETGDYAWLLLGAPAHACCVELVRGLTLPAMREEPTAEPRLPCSHELLAIVGLMAHRRLRMTKKRGAERASLRRIARDLGRSPEQIEDLVLEGLGRLMLGTDGDSHVRPRFEETIAAATGEDAGLPVGALDWFLTWILPRDEWVSAEALARALVREELRRPYPESSAVVRAELAASERFDTGSDGVTRFVRWSDAEPQLALRGDGWIDDALEVHLGAGATSACVAWVSLCCELERLDPELIYRLSEESIANARACSVPLAGIVTALDAVDAEGLRLPDDVRARVERWYAGAAGGRATVEHCQLHLSVEAAHYASYALGRAQGRQDDESEAPPSYPLACEAAPSLRKAYEASVADGWRSDGRVLEGRRELLFGEPGEELDLIGTLEAACEARRPVRVHVGSSGERLWVEPIRIHAPDSLYGAMLVAVDIDRKVDRVIAVHDIRGLRPERRDVRD